MADILKTTCCIAYVELTYYYPAEVVRAHTRGYVRTSPEENEDDTPAARVMPRVSRPAPLPLLLLAIAACSAVLRSHTASALVIERCDTRAVFEPLAAAVRVSLAHRGGGRGRCV